MSYDASRKSFNVEIDQILLDDLSNLNNGTEALISANQQIVNTTAQIVSNKLVLHNESTWRLEVNFLNHVSFTGSGSTTPGYITKGKLYNETDSVFFGQECMNNSYYHYNEVSNGIATALILPSDFTGSTMTIVPKVTSNTDGVLTASGTGLYNAQGDSFIRLWEIK